MAGRASRRALALLVLLAFIWGSSFTIIKVVVPHLPPFSLTAWRMVTATLVLVAAALWRGEPFPRSPATWGWIALAGLTGNVLPFTLISWAEERIDSGLAAILISLTPLAVVILAHFLTRDERLDLRRGLGVLLGLAGVIVLIGPGALSHLGEHVWRQLAVAAAALGYAVNTLIVKRLAGLHPVAMAAGIMAVSSLIQVPMALYVDGLVLPTPQPALLAVVLGVVHTGLATLIMFAIVAQAGASFFAMINFLIPVVGYVLGIVLLGEAPGARALAALALILAGIALVSRAIGRPRHES